MRYIDMHCDMLERFKVGCFERIARDDDLARNAISSQSHRTFVRCWRRAALPPCLRFDDLPRLCGVNDGPRIEFAVTVLVIEGPPNVRD